MKLKKFKQFINEDLDPADVEELQDTEVELDGGYDTVDDFKKEFGDDELDEEDFDHDDSDDDDDDIDFSTEREEEFVEPDGDVVDEIGQDVSLDDDSFDDEVKDENFEEEEEGHEYKGNLLMRELADKLGTEVSGNQINYNGKKINYYSETEKFHIGREKFETVEEVLDFLNPQEEENKEELEGLGESRKYIKRFN